MKLSYANALLRMSREGPSTGNKKSLKNSAEALQLWPSELGERFTTANWLVGSTSSTVKNILDA